MKHLTLITFTQLILFGISPWSHAVTDSSQDSLNYNSSKLTLTKDGDAICKDMCSLLDSPGPSGKKVWDKEDDQWCADHGSPTNSMVSAKTGTVSKTDKCAISLGTNEKCEDA